MLGEGGMGLAAVADEGEAGRQPSNTSYILSQRTDEL